MMLNAEDFILRQCSYFSFIYSVKVLPCAGKGTVVLSRWQLHSLYLLPQAAALVLPTQVPWLSQFGEFSAIPSIFTEIMHLLRDLMALHMKVRE